MPTSERHRNRGGCWPDAGQLDLLRVALGRGEEVRTAWARWREAHDLDAIDPASYRLLPLVFLGLQRESLGNDPWAGRLRGVYRKTWTQNRFLLHRAAPVIRALTAAGIPTLILKGAALAVRHYRSLAVRPMNDVDVLVPTDRGAEARQIVAREGLEPLSELPETFLPLLHGQGYRLPGGGDLDLHWHALHDCRRHDHDDTLWHRSLAADLGVFEARVLDDTDQLLVVCSHGARWAEHPPIHWIADAVTLLRSNPDLDWDRLCDQVEQRRLVLQIRRSLEFVRDQFEAPVPEAVVRRLRQLRVSRSERFEYRLRSLPPAVARGLFLHWRDHSRLVDDQALHRRALSFPLYLQQAWGLRRPWQVPGEAAIRFGRRALGLGPRA